MIRIDFFDDEELAEMARMVEAKLDEMEANNEKTERYFDGLGLIEKLRREQIRRKEIADGESETCNIL